MNFSTNKEEKNSITRNNNKTWNKETKEPCKCRLDIATIKKKIIKIIKNNKKLVQYIYNKITLNINSYAPPRSPYCSNAPVKITKIAGIPQHAIWKNFSKVCACLLRLTII